jgi:hypothetical protein
MMAHTPCWGVFLQLSGSEMTTLLRWMLPSQQIVLPARGRPSLGFMGDDVGKANISARRRIGRDSTFTLNETIVRDCV